MKKLFYLSILTFVACTKQQPVTNAQEQFMSDSELEVSKKRSKDLNTLERAQIEDWIKEQKIRYYPMGMNYWVNIENLQQNQKKPDGETISYEYEIYDFDKVKLYDKPKRNVNVQFGRFEELKAVEDALRYLDKNQEATLLVPSILAFGTYGDNDKIPNDMPLIIKIKVL